MRLRFALAFGLILIGWTAAQKNVIDQTALAELSPCVKRCINRALLKHDCELTNSCFCESQTLSGDLTKCLASCPFSDQLAAVKFQASTCKRPARNLSSVEALLFILYGVATLFTVARVLSRLHRYGGAGLGWDDFAAILSFFPLTAATACNWYAVDSGGGTDIWGLTVQNVHDFLLWSYTVTLLCIPVLLLTKASLILLYLRIWPFELIFRSACRATLVFLSAAFAAFQISAIAQCTPMAFQWERVKSPKSSGTCINQEAWLWSFAIVVICIDSLVLLLPVPKLLKLEVPTSRKAGLCAVFLVGLIVTAFSLMRLDYIRGWTDMPNFTRYRGLAGIYSNIEAYLSQICCCMPTIPGFVRRTYHYTTGQTPKHSRSATARRDSPQLAPPTSSQTIVPDRDSPRSADKTFTLSSASMFSAKSGAPAPVIHRHSNPLPQFPNGYFQPPSIFMKDYRETGPFPGSSSGDEEEDLAPPPPAIPRK